MAESTIGPRIAITGEQEFKAAIAGINNEFKLLGSEMKLAVSQFDKNDKSTEALTAQNKVLGKEIDAQKGRLSILTAQYDKQNSGLATLKTKLDATKAAFAADSAEVAKAQSAYDKQNNAVRTLQTDLNKAETGLNNMDKALKSNNQLLDEGAKKHGVFGTAAEKLGLNLGNLKTAFGAVGIAVGTYLVGAIGKAGEVEASTSRLTKLLENQGISAGEAGEDIKGFTKNITDMSTFSGGDAREALQVLAEKGISAGKSLEMAGTLANVAAGQNISLSSAADMVANAYNGKTKALTALGILSKEEVAQLGDTEDSTITMADVQQRLNDRFGGSAQADRATVNGQMKVMTNEMNSAKTAIGTALLPILAQLAQKLAEIVIPIVAFVKENPGFTKAILGIVFALGTLLGGASIISTIGSALGVLGIGAAGAGVGLGALILPVLAVVAAIALIGGAVYLVVKHWDDLVLGAKMAWANVTGAIKLAWDSIMLGITAAITNIQTFLTTAWNTIATIFTTAWNGIKTNTETVWTGIKTFFTDTWAAMVNTVVGIVVGFVTMIQGAFSKQIADINVIFEGLKIIFENIWDIIKNIFLGAVLLILDLVTGNFTKLKEDAGNIFTNLADLFVNIWENIKNIFRYALEIITTTLSQAWEGIKTVAETVWNGIKTFFENLWSNIKATASTAWTYMKTSAINIFTDTKTGIITVFNSVLDFFRNLPSTLYNLGSAAFTSLKSGISSILNTLGSTVSNGFSSAIDFITGLPGEAWQWGKDIIYGIVDGIRDAAWAVGDAVSGVAQDIRSFLHFSVPDQGPLVDYENWMPDFMGGLAKGIEKSKYLVANAVAGLSTDMSIGMNLTPRMAGMGMPGTTQNRTTNTNNSVVVQNMYVRNDQDIKSVARELYNLQQQTSRGRGLA